MIILHKTCAIYDTQTRDPEANEKKERSAQLVTL